MPLSRITMTLICCSAVWLSACAPAPTQMRYVPDDMAGDAVQAYLWPALPQVPRYRYLGQLTGEQNFGPAERSEPGLGSRILRWVTGLGDGIRQDPRVLIRPQSGMVDSSGRILVTDAGRGAVFGFDAAAGKLSVWESADQGMAFSVPVGIASGARGEILVADAELHRIVRLSPDGQPLGSFGEAVLQRPTGLARDPASGRVYVVDTGAHDIKVFDDTGRMLQRIGRRGVGPGEFNAPTHITHVDGRLYVSDTLNARVQVLDGDGQPLQIIGQRGLYVGNFTRPKGVAVDADRNVYVVESYYDHLLVFNRSGEFLLPIGGTGSSPGQFYLPAGIWSDDVGRLFVADMYNGRVVMFQYLGS